MRGGNKHESRVATTDHTLTLLLSGEDFVLTSSTGGRTDDETERFLSFETKLCELLAVLTYRMYCKSFARLQHTMPIFRTRKRSRVFPGLLAFVAATQSLPFIVIGTSWVHAFSAPTPPPPPSSSSNDDEDGLNILSRRNALNIVVGTGGAIVYGNLVRDAVGKLSRGDLVYPQDHEDRVAHVIRKSLLQAAIPATTTSSSSHQDELNILEVGIGSEWRVARRRLYEPGLDDIHQRVSRVKKIRLTGLDISPPTEKILGITRDVFSKHMIDVEVKAIKGSLTETNSELLDGSFDCVLCFLTLCSVDDQVAALTEIKRLLKPNGGIFGYVEHVAVNPDEPYRLLEFQQKAFDTLQQMVADNCHLHRYTEQTIDSVFQDDDSSKASFNVLDRSRFLVEGMWPVSCQTSGIIQRGVR